MEHSHDIAHLGHVEMLTDRFDESLDFFTRIYGLKLSGQDADSAYLRAWDDYEYCTLKLTRAETTGVGHIGYRAASPEALARRVAAIEASGFRTHGWVAGDQSHGRAFRFEGNAYSPQWHEEAKKRGLTIVNSTPEALALFLLPENRELLSKLHIMTDREVIAYYEIRLEQFIKTVEIEMGVLRTMVWEGILPALSKQILLESSSLSVLPEDVRKEACSWSACIGRLGSLKTALISASEKLDAIKEKMHSLDMEEQAASITGEVLPLCAHIRQICDTAESFVAGDIWPYPTYTKLLSIS